MTMSPMHIEPGAKTMFPIERAQVVFFLGVGMLVGLHLAASTWLFLWLDLGLLGYVLIVPSALGAMAAQFFVFEGFCLLAGRCFLASRKGQVLLRDIGDLLFTIVESYPPDQLQVGEIVLSNGSPRLACGDVIWPPSGSWVLHARLRDAFYLMVDAHCPSYAFGAITRLHCTFARDTPFSNHDRFKVEAKFGDILRRVHPEAAA